MLDSITANWPIFILAWGYLIMVALGLVCWARTIDPLGDGWEDVFWVEMALAAILPPLSILISATPILRELRRIRGPFWPTREYGIDVRTKAVAFGGGALVAVLCGLILI